MLKIIKIGGRPLENDDTLARFTDSLASIGGPFVVVHGGGSLAGSLAVRLGVESRMHEGRRITDRPMLDITVMAYAGLANKKIVTALRSRGINACGLSGCDMGIVLSHRRPVGEIDWGYVGDIDRIDTSAFEMLLERKVVPVISPITFDPQQGQLLNTNADSVAGSVAAGMAACCPTELTFCFDKPGVLLDVNDDTSVIPIIDRKRYRELLSEGRIHSGMLPKLENAFHTLEAGVHAVRLTSPDDLNGGSVIRIDAEEETNE